ncbi:ABC-2 type transport system permease protein [Clostridium cavendishii DSM 21758]|uniref:ABC-2 type transport system permease protein n=1 Tax=Clostridium cavendishii DSM 21758 TaxID=1121302 RepID=A0A1M6HYU2_9CLOT|nr:ABC transporter permease subunit [Clostridium cavendishii]SHJ27321.1 ABC-2 type transport system permease protein [Clostridium cavendishii DSM 21758]
MFKLIKNEIKKILLSKKYIIAIGIFLILYSGMTFLSYNNAMNSKPAERIKSNEKYIKNLNEEKNDKDITDKKKAEIDNKIKEIENINKNLQFQIENSNLKWQDRLKKNNEVIEQKIKDNKDGDEAIIQYKQEIEVNNYSLKNNIEPTPNNKVTAFSLMPKVNIFTGMLIITIIIAIISSDLIAGEFTPATIKLLLTKPVSRQKVLFSKFIAAICVCTVSFLLVKLIVFLIIGIGFGFGDYREPMGVYTAYINDKNLVAKLGFGVKPDTNSFKIYSVLQAMLLSEGINILFIIACTAVCLLISTLTKKSSSSISITVIFFVILSIFGGSQLANGQNGVIKKILSVLFTTYSSGELVISGETNKMLGFAYANNYFAIGILIVWIIVCYGIANMVFTKRDILS